MKRVLTAVALLLLAFYLIFIVGSVGFVIAALVTGLLCYREYDALVAAQGIPRPGILGALTGIFVLFAPLLPAGSANVLLGLSLGLIVLCIAGLRLSALKDILLYAACALFGALYTFAPWRFAIDLRAASVHLLFFALALNWAGDTAAYYIGRTFGKHPLAPVVSPKKSWEGAVAAVVTAILIAGTYLVYFVPGVTIVEAVLLTIAANIAGQLGDLCESAMKRG